MRKLCACGLGLGLVLGCIVMAAAQPPEGRDRPGRGDGPPRRGPGGPPGGPPRGWEPGRVMPPPIREELELTEDQKKQLADLEKEVKDRILKMLTAEQKKKLDDLRRRGPEGPPPPPPPPEREGRPPERPDRDQARGDASAGIQWFATWESGLREARQSGRPILLVSAAPHCAGVSGIW
jgi:hypothetical protein